MSLEYVQHKKISLKKHPVFNEQWLQDRIADDPAILGLGEVRLLDKERTVTSGGRLDILLIDDNNDKRYEVEVMLGATDPSHIIRTIEYWDIERRRYPGYEHVAVLIAEDITSRFLNVLSLMSGSIPFVAIQLDALQVGEQIVLNFVQVLDQTELRIDDTDDDGGGGQTDRAYWDKRAGTELMKVCDDVLSMVNEQARAPQDYNFLKRYIGLKSNGVVRNYVSFIPKPQKKILQIGIRNSNAKQWRDRFEDSGISVLKCLKRKFRLAITPKNFNEHKDLLREVVTDTIKEFGA